MYKIIKTLEQKLAKVEKGSIEEIDITIKLAREISYSNLERSMELINKAYKSSQKLDYKKGIASCKLNIGIYSFVQSPVDVKKALDYTLYAHEWAKEKDDQELIAQSSQTLGMFYWSFGDYEKGIKLTLTALDIARKHKYVIGIAWTLSALGNYYFDWKQYEESKKYYQEAYDLFESIDYIIGKARALNGIANIHLMENNYDKALELYHQSFEIIDTNILDEDNSGGYSKSRIYNDIGLTLQKKGKLSEALEYHEKSLEIRKRLNHSHGVTTTLMDIGDILVAQNKYDQAESFYNESLNLCRELNAKPKVCRALSALSTLKKKQGNFRSALDFHESCMSLELQINSETAEQKLQNLQTAFKTEAAKNEAEIHRLKNVELEAKNLELKNALSKLNAAQSQIVRNGNVVALGNLAAGVLHEINSPAGAILSSADTNKRILNKVKNYLYNESGEIDQPEYFEKLTKVLFDNNKNILDGSTRINDLVKTLQSFSRVDQNTKKITDIHECLDSTVAIVSHKIDDKIKIKKSYGNIPEIICNPADINQVIMNLLLNAIEAVSPKGEITISTSFEDKTIAVKISDNGKGIPTEKIKSIFEPGFSEKGKQIRMHTGLYNSIAIINEHNGNIKVKSKVNQGSSFIFTLPIH